LNRFNTSEWAGAFGDIGILIPFVIGYISIQAFDPLGVLFAFGVFLIISGIYYKTPFPVQPMKAIGGAAISQVNFITPNMIFGAGLFTGLFWLVVGLSGTLKHISKIIQTPIIKGISLGLGFSIIIQGTGLMRDDLLIAAIALIMTAILLINKKIPAMFVLIVFGVSVTIITSPAVLQDISQVQPNFGLPQFALGSLTWQELLTGIFVLAIPQLPLTFGNAVVAVTAENNRLFPNNPTTENKTAIFQGIMNLASPIVGGIPMCHGAGGMAAHVRFGARTGGTTIILGGFLLVLGLFFSNHVVLFFDMLPLAVLGVVLFFAGVELAMSARGACQEIQDYYILIVTAGFSIWNVGVGFLIGIILQETFKRNIFKID